MTREQFLASIKRITAFYGGSRDKEDGEKAQNYFNALYEQLSWIDGARFDDVCRHMVPNLNAIKKPMARSFLDGYAALFRDDNSAQRDVNVPLEGAELLEKLLGESMQLKQRQASLVLKLADSMGVTFPPQVQTILEKTALVTVAQVDEEEMI